MQMWETLNAKCWLCLFLKLSSYIMKTLFLSEKDQSKEKEKKVKKTIPAWATLSASQLARAQRQTPMASSPRPKMDAILTEAIKASCYFKHFNSGFRSSSFPYFKTAYMVQTLESLLCFLKESHHERHMFFCCNYIWWIPSSPRQGFSL